MSADFDFLRRSRSLEQQLGGGDPSGLDVARVQIVSDRSRHSDSFERAPRAVHWASLAAPAAGNHNGIIFTANDRGAPICGLKMHSFIFGATSATLSVGLYDPTLLTVANTAGMVPLEVDADPEVFCGLVRFTIATADIPIGTTPGWTSQFAGAQINRIMDPAWPLLQVSSTRQLVIIQNGPAEVWHFRANWQAVRL